MRRPSITRRLTITLTGASVLLWLVSSALALFVVAHEIRQSLDSAQQETAQRLLTLASDKMPGAGQPRVSGGSASGSGQIAPHSEYLTYQVRDAAGRVLVRSHDAPAEPFAAPLRAGFTETEQQRIYTEAAVDQSLFIHVAESHSHRTEAILESSIALLGPLSLLVPISVFLIARIVRRGMAPVVSLQQQICMRGSGNLSSLASSDVPEELEPIVSSVDRLLERLRAALDSERMFAANSAHELRSPLASALAQMQRLRATMPASEQQTRARQIEGDLRRLSNLTEKLLQLSRAEAGMARGQHEVALLPALHLVLDEFTRGAADGDARIVLDMAPATTLRGTIDVDAFAIVMRNLFENAVNHGERGTPARVTVVDEHTVCVVNRGPVVATSDLAGLRQRFERGSTSAKGAGLGLSIVDTIMQQTGGRLELNSPASGLSDGFEARVHFQ